MAPNIIEQFENHSPEVSDGRTEEAYWICLAFLVYDDIHKKEPSSLQDNQNLQACLDRKSTDTYKTDAYWLWHDLLDILDLLAPYEQDWIDDTQPQQEKEKIEKAILQPDQFCKTCWYWLDLIVNGIDEVDRA